MPVKRKKQKQRKIAVPHEARILWRKLGPGALGPCTVDDVELARLLGVEPLLAVSEAEMAEIRAGLEAGGRNVD
jgi:hypothetical protein